MKNLIKILLMALWGLTAVIFGIMASLILEPKTMYEHALHIVLFSSAFVGSFVFTIRTFAED